MDFIETLNQVPVWVDLALEVVPYIGGAATIGITLWGIYMTHRIWKEWR